VKINGDSTITPRFVYFASLCHWECHLCHWKCHLCHWECHLCHWEFRLPVDRGNYLEGKHYEIIARELPLCLFIIMSMIRRFGCELWRRSVGHIKSLHVATMFAICLRRTAFQPQISNDGSCLRQIMRIHSTARLVFNTDCERANKRPGHRLDSHGLITI
jgi:hypothetical protein